MLRFFTPYRWPYTLFVTLLVSSALFLLVMLGQRCGAGPLRRGLCAGLCRAGRPCAGGAGGAPGRSEPAPPCRVHGARRCGFALLDNFKWRCGCAGRRPLRRRGAFFASTDAGAYRKRCGNSCNARRRLLLRVKNTAFSAGNQLPCCRYFFCLSAGSCRGRSAWARVASTAGAPPGHDRSGRRRVFRNALFLSCSQCGGRPEHVARP